MIKKIIVVAGIFAGVVVAISMLLTPNSLLDCSDTPSNLVGCGPADAIVVVSGGNTSARTQQAIDLYENGWAPILVMSGAAADTSGPSNAAVMRDQAVREGVPIKDIFVEDQSKNTKQNAQQTNKILRANNVKSAIIVTSNYHAKRTLLEFERQGQDITYRIKPAEGDDQWSVWWWLNPYGWYLAISELVKIMITYIGGA